MGEELSSTPSMSNTIPRGGNFTSMVMLRSKAPTLSTPECKYRCSQNTSQRETRSPENRTRPILEADHMRTFRNRYAAQREIHFIDRHRLSIHASVPAGIVGIGE